MQGVYRYSGSFDPSRQLVGEHQIGKFGFSVSGERSKAAIALQVVQVQRAESVRFRRDVDDTRVARLPEAVEQQSCQQIVGEIIRGEHRLVTIDCRCTGALHDSGVVEEHVDPGRVVHEFTRDAANLGE